MEKVLPTSFEYEIGEHLVDERNGDFEATIRLKCKNEAEITRWKEELEEKTGCRWNVRQTKPNAKRFQYWKNYECQHGPHHKKESEKEFCKAKLTLKIKNDTRDVRKHDDFAKRGFLAVVQIFWAHNHPLIMTETANMGDVNGSNETTPVVPEKRHLEEEPVVAKIAKLEAERDAALESASRLHSQLVSLQERQAQLPPADFMPPRVSSPIAPSADNRSSQNPFYLSDFALTLLAESEGDKYAARDAGANVYPNAEAMKTKEGNSGRVCLILAEMHQCTSSTARTISKLRGLPVVNVKWLWACLKATDALPFDKYIVSRP